MGCLGGIGTSYESRLYMGSLSKLGFLVEIELRRLAGVISTKAVMEVMFRTLSTDPCFITGYVGIPCSGTSALCGTGRRPPTR